ncbi:hypothetical protein [Streptomyces thinghirensis]|uniref:hypothetical protein n=1 Tax=Streptomyces thinghirensis TaxID=551547 RepID=UPI0031EE7588
MKVLVRAAAAVVVAFTLTVIGLVAMVLFDDDAEAVEVSGGDGAGGYHVAMYAGDANALHAPRTGKTVELVPRTTTMPDADY